MSKKPLILLSNDDGIHAEGLVTLARALREVSDLYVVAPSLDKSATSHSITISTPLRIEPLKVDYCDKAFAVTGTPVDCVKLAVSSILKREPDWVISGINRGGNLGLDTLYSGTVGAALEGAIMGIPAMAVSSHGVYGDRFHYETAADIVLKMLANHEALPFDIGSILNINVPTVPKEALRGVVPATLGLRLYSSQYLEGSDPRGRPYYWLPAEARDFEDRPGSDCNLLDAGYATVTALHPSLLNGRVQEKLKASLGQVFNHETNHS